MSNPPVVSRFTPVAPGHVRLAITTDQECAFYLHLDIPVAILRTLCLKPIKFLRFIGYCVVGRSGSIVTTAAGGVADDAALVDQQIYFYRVRIDAFDLQKAIDLAVVKARTNTSASSSPQTEPSRTLTSRDGGCSYTGYGHEYTHAAHIIPFARGDAWLNIIIDARKTPQDQVAGLDSINDPRNAVSLLSTLHTAFDNHSLALVYTPNSILNLRDMAPAAARPVHRFAAGTAYPIGQRYTLLWLVDPLDFVPHNTDATFTVDTPHPLPSPLLLEYRFGIAAFKRWGTVGADILDDADRTAYGGLMARPPSVLRPPTVPRANTDLTQRRKHSQEGGGPMDAEELVFALWSSVPEVWEQLEREQKEQTQAIESWAAGVEPP